MSTPGVCAVKTRESLDVKAASVFKMIENATLIYLLICVNTAKVVMQSAATARTMQQVSMPIPEGLRGRSLKRVLDFYFPRAKPEQMVVV